MNIIKSIKNKIFNKKVSSTLSNIYTKEKSEILIHNDGKLCREGGKLFKIENHFTDGVYLRKLILNKGTFILGGIHKRDHVWFLLQGDITIKDYEGVKNFTAPYIGFSKAGIQRAIFANEYSIFQNVFQNPLNIKDLDKVEEYNYATSIEDYKKYKKYKKN